MLLVIKHRFKAHGLFCVLVVVIYRMYYVSVTDVVGENVMTEVQELLILPSCFKSVMWQWRLASSIANILFVTTVKHYFLIQKMLPTMHFKETKNHWEYLLPMLQVHWWTQEVALPTWRAITHGTVLEMSNGLKCCSLWKVGTIMSSFLFLYSLQIFLKN